MKWIVAGLALLACSQQGPPPHREWTDDMAFIITSDPVPPHARQDVKFTVIEIGSISMTPVESVDFTLRLREMQFEFDVEQLQPVLEISHSRLAAEQGKISAEYRQ